MFYELLVAPKNLAAHICSVVINCVTWWGFFLFCFFSLFYFCSLGGKSIGPYCGIKALPRKDVVFSGFETYIPDLHAYIVCFLII